MIVFDLRCSAGHTFEEWFGNSSEFDELVAGHRLICPECGDTEINKGLSAPRINGAASEPVGPCGRSVCGAGACQMMGD
jgi:hypothetical protein